MSDTPPRLLPGPSAKEWSDRAWRYLSFTFLFALLIPFADPLPHPFEVALVIALLLGGFYFGALSLRSSAAFFRRRKEEFLAGYTTLRRANPSLWRLEATTGLVLQRPNLESSSDADDDRRPS
jgi:hypothetical protein